MNARLVEALNEALERVEQGRSPEQALAELIREGRFAEAELRRIAPELAAATGLRTGERSIMDPARRRALKGQLVDLAAARPAARRRSIRHALLGGGRSPRATLLLRVAPLSLAVLLSLGSVIAISADSRPGDWLHPLQPVSRSIVRGLERVTRPVVEGLRATSGPESPKPAANDGPGTAPGAAVGDPARTGEAGAAERGDRSRSEPDAASERAAAARPTVVGRAQAPALLRTATPRVAAVAAGRALEPVAPPTSLAPPRLAVPTFTAPPTASSGDEPVPEEPEAPEPTAPSPRATDAPPPSPTASDPAPSATAELPGATPTRAAGATPTPAGTACGGTIRGQLLDGFGAPYTGPQPVTILASIDASVVPEMRLGQTESVDGAFQLELDPRVCAGQVESFFVVAFHLPSEILLGFHGSLAFGPSSLSVHFREAWDDVPVRIFVEVGPGGPTGPGCPVEDRFGRVSGQVLDTAAGPPVPFATIMLNDLGSNGDHRFANTDDAGRYRIDDACPGRYQVLVFPENGASGAPWGFWDPDGDGEADALEISADTPEHADIDILADVPGWP